MCAFICHFWAQVGCGKKRLFVCALAAIYSLTPACEQRFDRARGIVMRGTIVTMDAAGTILQNGSVLVRNNRIVAIWTGPTPPTDVPVGNAIEIDGGPDALIFPGLINLHDHPSWDVFEPWPAPSSHKQEQLGRPNGTEPYANRYQWNGMATLRPAPARLARSFTSTTPPTSPLWIPIRSCRRGCSLRARLISTAHCAGASGLV